MLCWLWLGLQMKKACLTRRLEQMRELGDKGELPVVLLGQLGKAGSGSLPAGLPAARQLSKAGSGGLPATPKSRKQQKDFRRGPSGCHAVTPSGILALSYCHLLSLQHLVTEICHLPRCTHSDDFTVAQLTAQSSINQQNACLFLDPFLMWSGVFLTWQQSSECLSMACAVLWRKSRMRRSP